MNHPPNPGLKKADHPYDRSHYTYRTFIFLCKDFSIRILQRTRLVQKKKALHSLQRASIRKETVPEGTVSYYSTGNLREIYANAFAPAALASAANLGSPNSGLCSSLATIRVPVPYAHSSGGLIISAPDPLITLPFSSLESFIHL